MSNELDMVNNVLFRRNNRGCSVLTINCLCPRGPILYGQLNSRTGFIAAVLLQEVESMFSRLDTHNSIIYIHTLVVVTGEYHNIIK